MRAHARSRRLHGPAVHRGLLDPPLGEMRAKGELVRALWLEHQCADGEEFRCQVAGRRERRCSRGVEQRGSAGLLFGRRERCERGFCGVWKVAQRQQRASAGLIGHVRREAQREGAGVCQRPEIPGHGAVPGAADPLQAQGEPRLGVWKDKPEHTPRRCRARSRTRPAPWQAARLAQCLTPVRAARCSRRLRAGPGAPTKPETEKGEHGVPDVCGSPAAGRR
jgi:hypothetical protein